MHSTQRKATSRCTYYLEYFNSTEYNSNSTMRSFDINIINNSSSHSLKINCYAWILDREE